MKQYTLPYLLFTCLHKDHFGSLFSCSAHFFMAFIFKKMKSIILCLIVINFTTKSLTSSDHCPSDGNACPPGCKMFDPKGRTVIYRDNTGRVGNQMFSYEMLMGLKLQFGFQAYMSRNISKSLVKYFPKVKDFIPVAEEQLCDFDRVYSKFW